jgi:ParB family chromosome partitioning protein
LHAVDRFDAFAKLSETMSPKEIAAVFGMKPKEVEKTLALGSLSPNVRQAWREGKMEQSTAQIFTLTSHARQDEVLAKLLKDQGRTGFLSDWMVRREIVGDDYERRGWLEFVGREAYRRAGGEVFEDLFDKNSSAVVSDPALLKTLVEQEIDGRIAALKADGWAWAEWAPRFSGNRHILQRLKGEEDPKAVKKRQKLEAELEEVRQKETDEAFAREDELVEELDALEEFQNFTPEQKAKSGCLLVISEKGNVVIEGGFLLDAQRAAKAEKEASGKKEAPAEKQLSNALQIRIGEQFTKAVAAALEEQPKLAVAVAVAAISTVAGPAKVHLGGRAELRKMHKQEAFGTVFARVARQPTAKQMQALASLLGGAFNFAGYGGELIKQKDAAALTSFMNTALLQKHLRKAFDYQDYAASAPKDILLKAAAEVLPKDTVKKLASKPKAAIVHQLVPVLKSKGWLPKEIRPTK